MVSLARPIVSDWRSGASLDLRRRCQTRSGDACLNDGFIDFWQAARDRRRADRHARYILNQHTAADRQELALGGADQSRDFDGVGKYLRELQGRAIKSKRRQGLGPRDINAENTMGIGAHGEAQVSAMIGDRNRHIEEAALATLRKSGLGNFVSQLERHHDLIPYCGVSSAANCNSDAALANRRSTLSNTIVTTDRKIRLGALVPAGNVVLKREFSRLSREPVEIRVLEFSYPAAGADFCADLVAAAQRPVRELRDWGAALIFLGCTAASMTCHTDERVDALARHVAVPIITAAGAVLEALAAVRATALTVATPYGANGNRVIVNFLTSQRLSVAAIDGFEFDQSPEVWAGRVSSVPAKELLDFSVRLDTPLANALFLPCTAMDSLETIRLFEQQTGKPAVSSVQAGYWACLRRLGVDGRRIGAGELLQRWEFSGTKQALG